jgi:hypothetical protein
VSSVLPGRHPDDDVLADLAAEVLPEPDARTVEAHVIGCPRCAELLADAERLRRLLMAEDPGPMPMDVLARIESALQAEASARSAGHGAPAAPGPDAGARSWDMPVPAQSSPRSPSGSAPGDDVWVDEPTPWDDPESWNRESGASEHRPGTAPPSGPRVVRGPRSRPGGRGTPASRSRRDLRESTRPGLPARGRWLASAAGLALVAGLGGLAVVNGVGLGMSTSDSGTASMTEQAAAGAQGGAVADVPYYASKTQYTSERFAAQVRSLVSAAPAAAGGPEASAATRTARAPVPSAAPVPSGSDAVGESVRSAAPGGSEQGAAAALRDPQRLEECLAALGQAGTRPVAVDFARYEGREAAVIVLPGRTGGYEAWAVDPTCGPEGDGLLVVKQIPPS